jgi:hypothetical protein
MGALALVPTRADDDGGGLRHSRNSGGILRTISSQGAIDTSNPFFQDLGANGRTCATCHVPADGWSMSPRSLKERFNATHGTDPVFRPVDGANSPRADVSTEGARRRA